MLRHSLIVLFALLLVGCSPIEQPRLLGVEVVEADVQGEEWPSHLMLRVEVENPSARVKILSGRVRIAYNGRRVAMLRLEDKVVLKARQRAWVDVPLHLAIQRNAQTVPLREALRRHSMEGIELDWQVGLRTRMTYVELEQGMRPAAEMLSKEQQQALWQMFE